MTTIGGKAGIKKASLAYDKREPWGVVTLGPAGTNSELAAERFAQVRRLPGSIGLRNSYEDGADLVVQGEARYLVVAAAYNGLSDLVYANSRTLAVAECFTLPTHPFVLAAPCGAKYDSRGNFTVGVHPAPARLLDRIRCRHPRVALHAVSASSNSIAAKMAAKRYVDLALTTAPAAYAEGLRVLTTIGEVRMAWVVLKRVNGRANARIAIKRAAA